LKLSVPDVEEIMWSDFPRTLVTVTWENGGCEGWAAVG